MSVNVKQEGQIRMERLKKQIEFIHEIDKLKYIQRKTKLFKSNRHENDAEHSWHLAMMAMVLAEHSNEPIDILKVLKMVLIHDIVEIDAGDTFLYDTTKSHDNWSEELAAAERIFGLLPTGQKEESIDVWKEFETGETNEAKFAKAIDRLEPVLQNLSNGGGTWTEFSVEFETVINKINGIQKASNTLWDYTEEMIDKGIRNGDFKL